MTRLPPFPKDENVLLVNEFFWSIQGESTHAGRPCFFIRLTGCHLRCNYCDTEYAFHNGEKYSIDEVMEKVRESGAQWVEVTGGEPLLQRPVYPLFERLVAAGYHVMVETSGSLDASRVPPGVHRIFDIKTPASGEAGANRWENFTTGSLRAEDEIKFVLSSREDYEWARGVLADRLAGATVPILFSPVWSRLAPADLAAWILEDRLPIRMQLQMHKSIWGNEKGK